ncbi:MAG: RNA pyrophosphohydrolase [Gammaproteobacteria bacterium]
MIDLDGYRANVGIVLSNREGKVLWARRIGQDAWQFPQGGIRKDEAPEQAMYRELREEIGLEAEDVVVLGRTRDWLRYRLPKHLIRRRSRPLCIGQKQVWYLLYLVGDEGRVRLDSTDQPEFDRWCWVDFWSPVKEVVSFKRNVYRSALEEFSDLLFSDGKVIPVVLAGKDMSLSHG